MDSPAASFWKRPDLSFAAASGILGLGVPMLIAQEKFWLVLVLFVCFLASGAHFLWFAPGVKLRSLAICSFIAATAWLWYPSLKKYNAQERAIGGLVEWCRGRDERAVWFGVGFLSAAACVGTGWKIANTLRARSEPVTAVNSSPEIPSPEPVAVLRVSKVREPDAVLLAVHNTSGFPVVVSGLIAAIKGFPDWPVGNPSVKWENTSEVSIIIPHGELRKIVVTRYERSTRGGTCRWVVPFIGSDGAEALCATPWGPEYHGSGSSPGDRFAWPKPAELRVSIISEPGTNPALSISTFELYGKSAK